MYYKMISLLLSIFMCLDLYAVGIAINTDPLDCDVSVRKLGSDSRIKVGKSPINTSFEEMTGNYLNDNNFVLIIEKDGYYPYELVISDLSPVDLNLQVSLEIRQDYEQFRSIDATISSLFQAQSLMRVKKYSEGLGILKDLEVKQPYLSIIPELIGSAYYLQKDLASSLDAYTKAYRINPENRDAFTMKKFLEKSLGTSAQ